MLLLDVNVLVYAHRGDAADHGRYRSWLDALRNGSDEFTVPEWVFSGFLRIVTHPTIFDPPSTLEVALEFCEKLRRWPNFAAILPGPKHWDIFLDLCRKGNAKGNLVPDAYIAALAIENGSEFITADRGARRWPGLRWRHPLDQSRT